MKRKIITTGDGSKTIQIEDWDEQYHSKHGAIQEAQHVFIKHGLQYTNERFSSSASGPICILEIGFGTGLNAFLTMIEAEKLNRAINYVGVEAFPVKEEELQLLNYTEQLSKEAYQSKFKALHDTAWESEHEITPNFILQKQQKDFKEISEINHFDLIYFDAFGARVQPELWTEDIFRIMFEALRPNGVLVTYSAKGSVRRAMLAVGFKVDKLPGPPGKREMLRAYKAV
ncbi:tRNA (5-methylaminomethyl-2-thiouridine)(34)-methyltransferase MnmD [Mangrovimonas sp. YM274]|uniref:tRNA (5-methylaminomethyl-2-thiouridine)(34)-methyltransferase MnmD n=1 Tax=Mangrovimonas sp. YM274 TaxID=3070660 RepID=UPI0027DE28BA|nr:tRNA (5-methylaminomethyl-2-thiouridine)(34)-methyltransferase MnmD [Mangrovimonas sp. YM274]WMI67886.1 tRNA (5-methylaminomethyl-2-thiouridine)(34)-methyltransferase MnmD [Mangrovimonas sp. YM274]